LTLWDVQACSAKASDPFPVLDLVRLSGSPDEMIKKFELHGVEIKGGSCGGRGAGSACEMAVAIPGWPRHFSGRSALWISMD
jgi:hypothetical protein